MLEILAISFSHHILITTKLLVDTHFFTPTAWYSLMPDLTRISLRPLRWFWAWSEPLKADLWPSIFTRKLQRIGSPPVWGRYQPSGGPWHLAPPGLLALAVWWCSTTTSGSIHLQISPYPSKVPLGWTLDITKSHWPTQANKQLPSLFQFCTCEGLTEGGRVAVTEDQVHSVKVFCSNQRTM